MNARHRLAATPNSLAGIVSMQGNAIAGAPKAEERLPFTVKIVRDEAELSKAVTIRHEAYGRHVPVLAELLKAPESCDRDDGSAVLLAESKLDGSPIGTMRIHTNRHRKLPLEGSVVLPEWLQDESLSEATRLGVSDGRIGRVVKTVLFKAYYDYCVEENIDWMVITARSPLHRQYEALCFEDVYAGGEFIPMRHVGNIPHRVMALEVAVVEPRWAAANHPLYDFFFRTYHPDIAVTGGELVSPEIGVRQAKSFHEVAIAA